MRISELSQGVGQGVVRLGGVATPARVLSAREDAFLRTLEPQPRAKARPTAQRGQVVMAPDQDDPQYRRALSAWALRLACLELAVCCGLTGEDEVAFDARWIDGDEAAQERASAWAKGVAEALAGTLSRKAIDDAIDELRMLEATMVERAYASLQGVEVEDLTDEERRRCRVNVGASANTVAVAAQLAEKYRPDDLARWWDEMPVGQRAVLVAVELFAADRAES